MKNQIDLLNKCLSNDIPFLLLIATDRLAIDAVNAYRQACVNGGCSQEFTDELAIFEDEFIHYAMNNETFAPTVCNDIEAFKKASGNIPVLILTGTDKFAITGIKNYKKSCFANHMRNELLEELDELETSFEFYYQLDLSHIPD